MVIWKLTIKISKPRFKRCQQKHTVKIHMNLVEMLLLSRRSLFKALERAWSLMTWCSKLFTKILISTNTGTNLVCTTTSHATILSTVVFWADNKIKTASRTWIWYQVTVDLKFRAEFKTTNGMVEWIVNRAIQIFLEGAQISDVMLTMWSELHKA